MINLEVPFNELSESRYFATVDLARVGMEKMLAVWRELSRKVKSLGATPLLRCQILPADWTLAPEYPVAKWRNDADVSVDLRRYFLTIATKAPLIEGLINDLEWLGYECKFGGVQALGFGIGAILGSPVLSLASSDEWARSLVDVELAKLSQEAEIVSSTIEVRHLSDVGHVDTHYDWMGELLTEKLAHLSGQDLLDARFDLFPNLTFSDQAEKSLSKLQVGWPILRTVRLELLNLSSIARNWDGNSSFPHPLNASPESKPTLDKFGEQRRATCEGVVQEYSWHLKLTPGAWRLYYAVIDSESVQVGLITKHLDTVSEG